MQLWKLRRRVHVSWLIAGFSLSFVVGVWLALYVNFGMWWLTVIVALAVFGAFVMQKVYVIPLIVVGGMLLGLHYGSVSVEARSAYKDYLNQQVTVSGRVNEDPSAGNGGVLKLQLGRVVINNKSLQGAVWASVAGQPDIKRGDDVTISGKLLTGFGTFPAMMTRAKVESISTPQPGDVGRVVRDWFADAVRVAIPEPQASLGIGYLVGQKSALPPDLAEALQIAGLTHIVVASGYNLTILVRLSRRLFMKISKFMAAAGSLALIASFIAMTGLSPSMSRAGLVSALSLATWYYGRRFHPFVLLPFAAAVTVIANPSFVWGDLGWQLSFAAFAGVMIVAPVLRRYFFGEKEPGTLRQILGETVAAHFVTAPIVVLAFGQLSNVAIPANLLIVPLVPIAMLLTFISGLLGLVVPMLAATLAFPATVILTYMTTTAQFFADLPWAQTEVKLEWWMGLIAYAVIAGITIYMWRKTKYDLREVNIVR